MDRFTYMRQKGWQSSDPVLLRSGNGFGLARFIGNAY
jgi:hypothetical protein